MMIMSKKILVTGGAGYIGSVLVRDLLDRNYSVRVFDSLYFGGESLNDLKYNPNFELIQGDIQNVNNFPNLLDDVDAVIHLAGLSNDPSCDLDPYYTKNVNVEGTRKLARMCKEKEVRKFLFSSSCSVYGTGITTQLDENSPKLPVSLYAKTKIECENILLGMMGDNFYPTILRNGTVFGYSPKMRFDLIVNIMTKNAMKDKKIYILGGGQQWRPNVHVKDVSKAFIKVLEAPIGKVKGEIFNVGSNDLNFQVYKVAEKVVSIIKDAEIEYIPSDQDNRDYNVNFDKINQVLGYTTDFKIEDAVKEIEQNVLNGSINDLEDVRYYSIKTIKELLDKPAVITGKSIRSTFLPFALPLLSENEEKEVIDTLRSGWLTTGPKTKLFEEKLKNYTGAKYAVALNSCTGALHLSLLTLGIKSGDEVITTPLTFAATVNVIVHVGAKPVFVDIDKDTLNINPNKIEEKITDKTKAIIPVHLAGQPCDMDKIHEIAKKYDLKVIEDAAHAIGAEYKGKKIGTMSDTTCFSFYPIKNITTGEGGAMLTDNEEVAERVNILSLHGISSDAWKRYSKEGPKTWQLVEPGFKYNMIDLQASLGLHQIDRLDSFTDIRRSYANIYEKEFSNFEGIILPKRIENIKHAWHLFIIILDIDKLNINRDQFMEAMKKENIATSVHFPSLIPGYYNRVYGYKREDFPNANFVWDRIVSLPLYPKMSFEDLKNVIDAVKKIINYYRKK